MKQVILKGFPDTTIQEINRFNYLVSINTVDLGSFAKEEAYVKKVFTALMSQHSALDFANIYIYLRGDVRYFHKARQLRGEPSPVKIMPSTTLTVSCNLAEAYFKAQNEFEIRYYLREYQGTYQCLGAAWDGYGPSRGNIADVSGKLICNWDSEIAAARLNLLSACDDAPGRWQSNGYHYPNKPTWNLFDKAQSFIPEGFHFTQKALKLENAAIVNDIPADYVLILKDAPRYAKQQRAFWDSVTA